MTAAQHTPGPWTAYYDQGASDENYNYYAISEANDEIELAVLHANARLIAAAPELALRCERQAAEIARLRDAIEKIEKHAYAEYSGDALTAHKRSVALIGSIARKALASDTPEPLYAAAPRMLAALQMFLDCEAFIPPIKRQSQDDEEQDEERRAVVVNECMTAISKATGE
ncbi:MAG: hypothetical protein JWN34_376 [Bryobacterales bacterium]|nr:hypothetical protein [Bryobacterales bacterium]